MSTVLSAWLPPFKIFIIGTGISGLLLIDKYSYKGQLFTFAAALQAAIDTPSVAFAPSLDLLSVPSSSIIISSIFN